MRKQRGVALSGLLIWGVVIILVAALGMKIGPKYLEYYNILKSVKSAASQSAGKTVPQIRADFDKNANVNYVEGLTGADLDISKDGGVVVISFAYEKRIPLFANISLLIEFEGSSAERDKTE